MFEIGPSLREARLHKGVEIPDAERATKIRAKYLRALETESFDVLPGQAYIKSFLRSYADYLGLDGQLLVDEYTSRFWVDEEAGPVRTRRIRIRERHHRRAERRMVMLTVIGIAVVTALVIAAWNYGGGPTTQRASRTSGPQSDRTSSRTRPSRHEGGHRAPRCSRCRRAVLRETSSSREHSRRVKSSASSRSGVAQRRHARRTSSSLSADGRRRSGRAVPRS